MRRILIPSLLLALAAAPVAASPSAQLQPHRAIYSLKLANAEPGSGVTSADGAMIFEWAESCEGWTIQQKSLFDVYGAEGAASGPR